MLDREFVTTSSADATKKIQSNDAIIYTIKPNGIAEYIINTRKGTGNPDATWAPVPHMIAPGVNPKYVCWPQNLRGFRCFSIPSDTKKADAAVRLIEAFCDEDLVKEVIWGREGIEYNIVDGKKVLDIEKHKETAWRNAYSFMWQQQHMDWISNITEQVSIANFKEEGVDGTEIYEKYVNPAFKLSKENGKVSGPSTTWAYIEPDDISLIRKEAATEANKLIIKAIMGQISMEEYDKEVAEFEKKYSVVTENFKEWWEKNRSIYE